MPLSKTIFPTLITVHTPSTRAIVSAAASAFGTAVLLRTIARNYLPSELQHYISAKVKTLITMLIKSWSSDLTFVIEEYDDNLSPNHIFKAAELYLEPIIPSDTRRLKLSKSRKESKFSISVERNQEIVDTFNGVTLKWKFFSKRVPMRYIRSLDPYYRQTMPKDESNFIELKFHKKHREMVLEVYLNHVIERSKVAKERKKILKLYTLGNDRLRGGPWMAWQSVNLDHPATFDTLAMDMDVKKMIMEDLERFVRRKELYRKVGKAWKRGYLLFGPPGTGKSSLIAAMANYLKFDVYDLELSDLRGNFDFRKLLTSTGNKSILVVEDIDCSIELQDRVAKATRVVMCRTRRRVHPGNYQGTRVQIKPRMCARLVCRVDCRCAFN